jgi:hypothetical protein
MMESIRVALSSDQWWDIKSELTRGDKRHVDREVESSAFQTLGRIEGAGLTMEKLQEMSSKTQTSATRNWGTEEEEAYLIRCSVAWSFEESITPEEIGNRSNKDVELVLARMRNLYVEDDDDTQGKSLSAESLNSQNHEKAPLKNTETPLKRSR